MRMIIAHRHSNNSNYHHPFPGMGMPTTTMNGSSSSIPTSMNSIKSRAVASVVDAYATRLLRVNSCPSAGVDPSLGPYVTSILRRRDCDEEQLLELLQDHCGMSLDVAQETLQTLSRAVRTGVVPAPMASNTMHNVRGKLRSQSVGAEHESYAHVDAIRLLGGMLADSGIGYDSMSSTTSGTEKISTNICPRDSIVIEEEMEDETRTSPDKPAVSITRTPLKPDRLIPVDLLGEIDHPTDDCEQTLTPIHQNTTNPQSITTQNSTIVDQNSSKHEVMSPQTLFPPKNPEHNDIKGVSATPQQQQTSNGQQQGKKDLDIAAALFRPSRPRANSVNTALIPQKLSHHKSTVDVKSNEAQLQTVQLLLTMNYDLSEEAAREAAKVAPNADVNIAQHVLDQAMTAPPVCRHMLHDACYRSDCQFSHDVEGHTCLFWLRGKCGKHNCKFLHGFSKKALDGVKFMPTPAVNIKIETTNLLEHNMQHQLKTSNHNIPTPRQSLSSSPTCSSPLFLSTSLDSFTPTTSEYCGFINSADSKYLLPPRDKSETPPIPVASSSPSTNIPLSSSLPEKSTSFSFAKIATKGYNQSSSFSKSDVATSKKFQNKNAKKVKMIKMPPELLWNSSPATKRKDVVELTHVHTTKTFQPLLGTLLPEKLRNVDQVWILFERSNKIDLNTVVQWLLQQQPHYEVFKTKDAKALCVKKNLQQQQQAPPQR